VPSRAALHPVITRIGLIAVSTIAALYAVELVLWLNPPQPSVEARAAALGNRFDPRNRYEVVVALRDSGVDAYPAVLPRHYFEDETFLPLSGVSRRRTVLCNETGEFVIYDSDELGFNNPAGAWQQRRADIVLLGDSYIHGNCVPREHTIAGVLRTWWPRTINLGMAGTGPLLQYATLLEYAQHLRPRHVVWAFFEGNDFGDLNVEREHPVLQRYLQDGFSQKLLQRQPSVDSAARVLANRELARFRATGEAPGNRRPAKNLLDLWEIRSRLRLVRQPKMPLDFHTQLLQRARTHVQSWGGELYFLYLPSWTRALQRPGASRPMRDSVLTRVRALGIPVIDVYRAFQERGPQQLFAGTRKLPGHYSIAGNALAAGAIAAALRSTDPVLRTVPPAPAGLPSR
jgi:hypothetical protein